MWLRKEMHHHELDPIKGFLNVRLHHRVNAERDGSESREWLSPLSPKWLPLTNLVLFLATGVACQFEWIWNQWGVEHRPIDQFTEKPRWWRWVGVGACGCFCGWDLAVSSATNWKFHAQARIGLPGVSSKEIGRSKRIWPETLYVESGREISSMSARSTYWEDDFNDVHWKIARETRFWSMQTKVA